MAGHLGASASNASSMCTSPASFWGLPSYRSVSPLTSDMEALEADPTRVLSGTLSRLVLTLYAPDSAYDQQIKQITKSRGEVCSKEAVPEGTPARDPEDTSGFTSCSSPTKLVLPASPLNCCNISTGRTQSVQPGNGTLCAPCGASPEMDS